MKDINFLKTSSKAIDIIKYFEGFSAKIYHCIGGYATIGYGHKIAKGESLKFISFERANEILYHDIFKIEKVVDRNINVVLNNNQFSALVSFIYNIGSASFQRSTIRQKINFEQWEDIENEFNRWIFVRAKAIQGLRNRRIVEYKLFSS